MMSRRTARTVLPPLFALALVALVTRPAEAPALDIPATGTAATATSTVTTR